MFFLFYDIILTVSHLLTVSQQRVWHLLQASHSFQYVLKFRSIEDGLQLDMFIVIARRPNIVLFNLRYFIISELECL